MIKEHITMMERLFTYFIERNLLFLPDACLRGLQENFKEENNEYQCTNNNTQ